MTIAEILSNEELRRHEFPVAGERVFLAHAAVSPLPRRVSEAMRDHAARATLDDQEETIPAGQIQRARELAARLLHALPEEIALVGPTSLALSYVAAGLPWRKGDNVLVYFDDYPSNVYPWMALAEKGVEVRLLNIREYGRIRTIDVIGQVDENTRLVALASNHFVAGWRLELDAIGRHLRQRNILFCVDGIQTVGAFPTPLRGRFGESGRPGGAARGDGASFGSRRGKHRRRIAPQKGAVAAGLARARMDRAASRRAPAQRQRHP